MTGYIISSAGGRLQQTRLLLPVDGCVPDFKTDWTVFFHKSPTIAYPYTQARYWKYNDVFIFNTRLSENLEPVYSYCKKNIQFLHYPPTQTCSLAGSFHHVMLLPYIRCRRLCFYFVLIYSARRLTAMMTSLLQKDSIWYGRRGLFIFHFKDNCAYIRRCMFWPQDRVVGSETVVRAQSHRRI